MQSKLLLPLILLFLNCNVFSQNSQPDNPSKGGYVFIDLAGDTILYREKAAIALRLLKKGSVVVRLKTNDKSIEAYRNAGQVERAERIETDRRSQNQKIYDAFKNYFTFCRVFFIYSKDTKRFLDGERSLFLNKDLQYDASIVFTDTNFVFCEYGSVEAYSQFTDQSGRAIDKPSIPGGYYSGPAPHTILDTMTRRTSTSPATTSGLFFSDKDLKQFYRPFPYSEAVYFDNPSPTVRSLNNQMERMYLRLVVSNDFRIKMKEERKKEKQKQKSEPRYNPFK